MSIINNVAFGFGELAGMISLYFLLRHFVRVTRYIGRFWRRYNLKNRATAIFLLLGFVAVIAGVGFALYIWTRFVSGHFEVDAFDLAFFSAAVAGIVHFGKPSQMKVFAVIVLFVTVWLAYAAFLLAYMVARSPLTELGMMAWVTMVTLGMFGNVWLILLFSAVLIWATQLQWIRSDEPGKVKPVFNDNMLWVLIMIALNPQKES